MSLLNFFNKKHPLQTAKELNDLEVIMDFDHLEFNKNFMNQKNTMDKKTINLILRTLPPEKEMISGNEWYEGNVDGYNRCLENIKGMLETLEKIEL